MCQQNVQGDGNCCFSAVAFRKWEAFTDRERDALQSRGLFSSMSIITMAVHLRKLAVEEWLSNSLYYQSFLVDSVRVEEEAMKFLLPEYFHEDLAETMGLLIAFSSIQCHPVVVVTPRTLEAKSL